MAAGRACLITRVADGRACLITRKKNYMKLSDFNFELPNILLAQRPSPGRDESRLMVLNRAEKTIKHQTFKDVIDYFDEGDLMVLNMVVR